MCDESFDLEDLEWEISRKTETAWSSQVAPKARGRRTYSRRASTSAVPADGTKTTSRTTTESHGQSDPTLCGPPSLEGSGRSLDWGERSPPLLRKGTSNIPGRRKFTRAHSVSGSSNVPKLPPLLRRSKSISSRSSASYRSLSIDSGSSNAENIHPNSELIAETISPKRCAGIDGNVRGRKKVRSLRNSDASDSSGSSSFSNLARYGDDNMPWPPSQSTCNTPQPPSDAPRFLPQPSLLNDFEWTDLAESSPADTSVGSCRKRELPLDHFDDSFSAGALSVSRPTRSRSRLFSPPTTKLSEFSLNSVEQDKRSNGRFSSGRSDTRHDDARSDDGDSGPESKDGLDTDDEASIESLADRSPFPSFVPYSMKKKRPDPFNGPEMTPSARAPLEVNTATADDVISSMSSHQDLKYLTKLLRAENRSNRQSWHVVLPMKWDTTRRAKFLQWTTRDLGFALRKGGMSISFIQVSKGKGGTLLQLLETTLSECTERGLGGATPRQHFTFLDVEPTFPPGSVSKKLSLTPRELMSNSGECNTGGGAVDTYTIDETLLGGMKGLGMEERPVAEKRVFSRPSIVVPDDEAVLEPPRPSLESHTTARDLMAHMHGTTPVPRKNLRPPRLSIQSIGSTVSKYTIESPFPQPTIPSSCKSSGPLPFLADFVQTPMMKPPDQGWGSRPIPGRDWGTSEPADPSVIKELLLRLSKSRAEAGFQDSQHSSPEAEPCFSRPASLGLDLEAACDDSKPPASTGLIDMSPAMPEESTAPRILQQGGHTNDYPVPFAQYDEVELRNRRRRQTSVAKHRRVSLIASAINPHGLIHRARNSLFVRPPRAKIFAAKPVDLASCSLPTGLASAREANEEDVSKTQKSPLDEEKILELIFGYLGEGDLLRSTSLVCTKWADLSTRAHADLVLSCMGISEESDDYEDSDDESSNDENHIQMPSSNVLERTWQNLVTSFPWACFLSEGAYKKVYKVYNSTVCQEEAISIMDVNQIQSTGNLHVVGAELAVSVLLSSLVRRGICPNFLLIRGIFCCPYAPPQNHWGSASNRFPKGHKYSTPKVKRNPKEPSHKQRGRFQYIRMELCDSGDAEEFLKGQPNEALNPDDARKILFQISFALHAGADRFSLKHYDVKLLNVFLQHIKTEKTGDVVLRYGFGQHTFALRSPKERSLLAKLADYGTANVDSASNGQQVTLAQFTTIENTPPDFFILGDKASQGHEHDCFGLGLCMLHLFTGHAPYEEILDDVRCPPVLKQKLRLIWEDDGEVDFSVVRSVILSDVYKDEEGHIIEGEPDETIYDTLYKYLVLFGLQQASAKLQNSRIWEVVQDCLEGSTNKKGRGGARTTKRKNNSNDASRFARDRRKYSVSFGTNKYIARARRSLESMDGGLELLLSLVAFDPQQRASAMDVLNSSFMAPLIEPTGVKYSTEDEIRSYCTLSTQG